MDQLNMKGAKEIVNFMFWMKQPRRFWIWQSRKDNNTPKRKEENSLEGKKKAVQCWLY